MMKLAIAIDGFSDSPVSLIGGKAQALGRLYESGIHIPHTVCISTDCYRDFITQTGICDKVLMELERKAFGDMRWEELWDSSLRIRNFFIKTPIPDTIRATLVEAIEPVFENKPTAVRSSAPGEDSSKLSFAGLHESYINISGTQNILDHIRLVWASLFSDRALLYRQELGLDAHNSAMAVIIQEMILGEVSGVAFGMSPMDRNQAIIEAVPGLNQDLVDGSVEPSRWVLSRDTGHIVSQRHPEKESVTSSLDAASMSRLVNEVFELLCRLERLFGSPQDLEWTHTGSALVALQSRPITTISSMDDDERQYYLTLRRNLKNLLELKDEIENVLIPHMQREAAELAAMDLRKIPDADLIHEVERRRRILKNWEHEYKEKCIPFAHSMRLFAEVYNEQVHPDDPFEFMKVLGHQQLVSVERNALIQEMADLLKKDSASLECMYKEDVTQCSTEVLELIAKFQASFADSAWQSESLFQNSVQIAQLISSYMEKSSKKSEGANDVSLTLANRFLWSFSHEKKEYASTLLDVARSGYRLRDDDNIYLGKIHRQLIESEKEACLRGILNNKDDCRLGNGANDVPSSDDRSSKTLKPHSGHEIFEAHTRQIVGQPAGPGLGTGKARVVTTPEDLFQFRADEILVCDAIDPNMTFIVPLAAGIVERRGGMLIHGAIIAREYGIPCVTGVPEATQIIKTGETVTVDGFLGIVIIG